MSSDEVVIEKELVVIKKAQAMDIFTKRELIQPLLDKIERASRMEEYDVSTDKGRKAIASMAYRVAQSKTYIESHGKELAAELKELPKLVDSNRKYAKDFLDALRDRIRKPLDGWEAEQAAIQLKADIENYHEDALIMDVDWTTAKKAEQDRLDQEKADYEAKVLAEAEARAKIQAEEKARKEIIDAEARALTAEREALRVQEQAKLDVIAAEERAKAQAELELRIKEREAVEEQARIHMEKSAKTHTDAVHLSIINDLLAIGLNDKQAEFILNAVIDKKIKLLRIEY